MIAPVASVGRPSLTQAIMARAVSPAAQAPRPGDRPPPPAAPSAAAVTLGPAAMSALIEAQARLAQDAPLPIRQRTAEKIGLQIYRLDQAAGAGAGAADPPFAVRRLESVREALECWI